MTVMAFIQACQLTLSRAAQNFLRKRRIYNMQTLLATGMLGTDGVNDSTWKAFAKVRRKLREAGFKEEENRFLIVTI